MEKFRYLVTVFFAIGLLSLSLAKSANADEKREVSLVGIDNFSPYSSLDENGKPKGIYIDIVKHLFEGSGYSYNIKIMPFRRSIKMAMADQFDGIIGVYSTPERRENLHYLDAFLTQFRVSLLVLDNSAIKTSDISDVKGSIVGKKRGFLISPTYDSALDKGEFKASEVESIEQLVSMLLVGRTDAFVATVNQVLPYLKKINREDAIKELEPPLRVGTTYLAFSKKMLEKIPDDFILEMEEKIKFMNEEGIIEEIHQKHGIELYTPVH